MDQMVQGDIETLQGACAIAEGSLADVVISCFCVKDQLTGQPVPEELRAVCCRAD